MAGRIDKRLAGLEVWHALLTKEQQTHEIWHKYKYKYMKYRQIVVVSDDLNSYGDKLFVNFVKISLARTNN